MDRARLLLVVLLVSVACGGSGGGGSGSGDALGPPTGVTADALSATSVQLNWQDNSWAEDGFRIDRAVGTGQWAIVGTVPANEVGYVDSSALASTPYVYRVVAYTSSRFVPSANEANLTTPGTGAGSGSGPGTTSSKIRMPIGTDATDAKNNYYNASGFLNFVSGLGYHLGHDWNGKSGGDTDLGKPVYAVANGTVKAAKDFGKGWGNCVAIEHDLGGQKYVSWYAHLYSIEPGIAAGNAITQGTKLGGIGKGYQNKEYAAHLHFEWRTGSWSTPRDKAGPGYVSAKTTPPPQGQVDPQPYY